MSCVIAALPCSKPTFYEHFPDKSNQLNQLKEMLAVHATNLKKRLRKKWGDSDNATLQMALYKLLANEKEHKSLQQTYQNVDVSDKREKENIVEGLSTTALEEIARSQVKAN